MKPKKMATVKAWAVKETDDFGDASYIAISHSSNRLFIFTDEESAKMFLSNCREGSVIVRILISELPPKRKAKR